MWPWCWRHSASRVLADQKFPTPWTARYSRTCACRPLLLYYAWRGNAQPALGTRKARMPNERRASVKIYPGAILSTGYRLSYNRVLRAVLQKPFQMGYLLTEVVNCALERILLLP